MDIFTEKGVRVEGYRLYLLGLAIRYKKMRETVRAVGLIQYYAGTYSRSGCSYSRFYLIYWAIPPLQYLSQDTYYLDIEEATVFKRPDNIQNKDEGD